MRHSSSPGFYRARRGTFPQKGGCRGVNGLVPSTPLDEVGLFYAPKSAWTRH